MTKHPSTAELQKMSIADLTAEIRESNTQLAKLGMGLRLQKEKDSAKYKKEKKHLARMKTVLTARKKEERALSSQEKQVSSPSKK